MALAPRPGHATNPSTGQRRDSGLGKEGKRAQRARNKGSDTAHLTNSGSSGKALAVAQMPKVDFAELKDLLVPLCDIAAKLSHTQVGSSGWMSATLNVPLEYTHDVIEAHLASQQGMIFMRVYYVPTVDYLAAAGDETGGFDLAQQ